MQKIIQPYFACISHFYKTPGATDEPAIKIEYIKVCKETELNENLLSIFDAGIVEHIKQKYGEKLVIAAETVQTVQTAPVGYYILRQVGKKYMISCVEEQERAGWISKYKIKTESVKGYYFMYNSQDELNVSDLTTSDINEILTTYIMTSNTMHQCAANLRYSNKNITVDDAINDMIVAHINAHNTIVQCINKIQKKNESIFEENRKTIQQLEDEIARLKTINAPPVTPTAAAELSAQSEVTANKKLIRTESLQEISKTNDW